MKILTAGWAIGNHENKRGDDGHKGRGWGRWGVGRWKGAGVGWSGWGEALNLLKNPKSFTKLKNR